MSGRWSPAGSAGRPRRGRFPAGLFTGLLPAGVAVVDGFDGSFDGCRLTDAPVCTRDVAFPAEFDGLGAASPQRRQEFARARICAHAAVTALGRSPEPILLGSRREPRWPAGLVGSITHCPGYRAAAVAEAADVLAVGVDAEPDQQLPAEVSRLAFTDIDRAGSGPLARFRNWDRVAFSARESVFKAWFTMTGRWLDFADATLFLRPDGPDSGDFTATIGAEVAGVQQLLAAGGSAVLTGRFCCAPTVLPVGDLTGSPRSLPTPAAGLVLTAVTLRRGQPPGEPSSPAGGPSLPVDRH